MAARLYSAPIGAKRVARAPEKEEPDMSKPEESQLAATVRIGVNR